MDSGHSSSSNSHNATPPSGRLTEAERLALRKRAAQARAAASEAIERYAMLTALARHRLSVSQQTLIAIDSTREMLRQSVQHYAKLMRALDTPPERMLRLVRETLRYQLPHPEGEEDTKALIEDVVTWSIEAYYLTSPAA